MDNIKNTPDVKAVIDALTTKFNIEQIYLNTYDQGTSPFELVILVSSKYIKTLDDLVPRIMYTIGNYPQYKVMCYVAFQAKDKIREGNLYLFASCQPQKLIYKKEDSEFEPIPKQIDHVKCKELAIALRDREQQKIDEFKEGYYFFKEKENYGLASFMLHQAVELTYRYLELQLIAKERITHSIRGHHLYLKRISAAYTGIFDEEDDNDILLLQVLDNIYRSTRYEDDFRIDIDTLKQLESKMETLHTKAVQVFEHIVASFEQQHAVAPVPNDQNDDLPNKTKSMKLDDNKYLKEAIEQLKERIKTPVAIYVFGHRARSFFIEGINDTETTGIHDDHFDLLVVSETYVREKVMSLQGELNKRLGISLLLLSYTKDHIQKQLDKNNPYFHRVLQKKGSLLYAGLEINDWCFHENNGVRTEEELKKCMANWYKRETNASGFFNGATAIEDSEEFAVKVLLYNQAMEQASLGLLESFYGYTPYQQNLNHLYNLCCSFWYFPNDIFPRFTEEDKRLFNEFAHVVKSVLYKGLSYIDWDEAFRYEARCERFLEECSTLVRETFLKNSEPLQDPAIV
ncbi:HEPN domain-containing protein [Sinomicrobium pectinilyticum]|uniref:HEPN domain-containing protein n=1 Tax=Sinomicrobium pectinilyticum TaxID=1084421 RepID=A0A3N0EFQ1_SINP1|nr:HEPN domain-containing protein [Sinomicrobium pectinilyticum]RNL86688.1 HEPN domain-containing protein [Sinomicrobium pectinilyticum]